MDFLGTWCGAPWIAAKFKGLKNTLMVALEVLVGLLTVG
jgi:hypothetical protein